MGHQWNALFHFSFLILDRRYNSLDGGSACRKVATYTKHKHRIYAYTDIHAPSRIRTHDPMLERAKTVHAATGIGATVSGDIKVFLRIFPVICVHLMFCILFPAFMSSGSRVSVILTAQCFRLTKSVPRKIWEWWNTWEITTSAHVETGNYVSYRYTWGTFRTGFYFPLWSIESQ
jgi:hypothetical protein